MQQRLKLLSAGNHVTKENLQVPTLRFGGYKISIIHLNIYHYTITMPPHETWFSRDCVQPLYKEIKIFNFIFFESIIAATVLWHIMNELMQYSPCAAAFELTIHSLFCTQIADYRF